MTLVTDVIILTLVTDVIILTLVTDVIIWTLVTDVTILSLVADVTILTLVAGLAVDQNALPRDPNNMKEDERIAEMGKPRLGDHDKIRINIKESAEFKLLGQNNTGFVVGTSSWAEQFKEALTVSAGGYLVGGWACFVVSILWIGMLTAVIGDTASAFGCTIGLLDSVTAISFVALGTSVPDTFASKVAAVGDQYADSSVGNVTGSNAVNVFLGIGIAWTMAAIVNKVRGEKFEVEPGSLGFSVTLFVVFAIVAIILILIRRSKAIGGELGGPMKYKLPSSIFMASLWISYVIISAMEAYGIIEGF
ncbi:SLC8A3 [Bugula neritina]|uniref:SLC8A3 n=1 Tax=Bugula neritina TaxID=10212 RepID=A0A7J7JYY9_BUGNE|nr:SLC8A3 [Bugula neritina]